MTSTLPGLDPVTLSGRYVRLEPLTVGHIPALAAASAGPRDTYAFTWVPDGLAEAVSYVDAALADRDAGRALPFATVSLATGAVVGSTRFGNIEYFDWPEGGPLRRNAEHPDVIEIGWTWLNSAAQRTPINTEAKLLMLAHAFEGWGVHRVSLVTDERNERSRRAIERLGARLDGVIRGHRVARDGLLRDTAWYSIVRGEWPAVRDSLRERLGRD